MRAPSGHRGRSNGAESSEWRDGGAWSSRQQVPAPGAATALLLSHQSCCVVQTGPGVVAVQICAVRYANPRLMWLLKLNIMKMKIKI